MANNKQYIELLNMVIAQEESRLITIAVFGTVLVLVALLLPSKMLTLTLANSSKNKKHSNQKHLEKEKKRTYCCKPILVIIAVILLISGGAYKTIELRRINDDICKNSFVTYEGLFQYDSLYHDYYYGRIDFLDKNGAITGYAFYPDRTNSHQTYSSNMNALHENQICEGIVVYSLKSKIVLDLIITIE